MQRERQSNEKRHGGMSILPGIKKKEEEESGSGRGRGGCERGTKRKIMGTRERQGQRKGGNAYPLNPIMCTLGLP